MELPAPQELSRWSPLREWRVALDVLALLRERTPLAGLPPGEGRPVLVLPGFNATDRATSLLRRRLRALGYEAYGWGLGLNNGQVNKFLPRLIPRVRELAAAHGQPVALIGWSLGGYIAREILREAPEAVARVITLGSPVVGGPKYTATARWYRQQGVDLDEVERRIAARETAPLQKPILALYSRHDGIVHWGACFDRRNPQVRHEEVRVSHLGMTLHPQVFRRIAQALAEPAA
jgi:pimeloyl-ACP methyl ester carboxylesterase